MATKKVFLSQDLKKTMSRSFLWLNIFIIFILAGALILVYLLPDWLSFFYLNEHYAKVLILFFISLFLLLASFSGSLSFLWRIFTGVASLLVLAEMILMCNWWREIIG